MEKMNPIETEYKASIDGFTGLYSIYSTERFPKKGNTLTGYGKNIPTRYMIKMNKKLYRVKMIIFSNSGTFYIKIKNKKHTIELFD